MYSGTYAPWEHYPKTLRHDQVVRPLTVLAEFFNSGWPAAHAKELKEWRDYVLADKFYNHKHHGPGNLLFTCRINGNLLEAMYLLLFDFGQKWPLPAKAMEQQLATERETWQWFPDGLKRKHQLDPHRLVKKVFKDMNLSQYRDHLKDWAEAALSSMAIDETITPAEVVMVYENLLNLYAAAWLIHQRTAEEPYLKDTDEEVTKHEHDEQGKEKTESEVQEQDSRIGYARTLEEKIKVQEAAAAVLEKKMPVATVQVLATPAEALGLEEVKALILKKVPAVQMIVHLGTHQKPFTYYLLVLIADSSKAVEHEVSNTIEDYCKHLVSVMALVHKTGSAKKGISEGNVFWNNTLKSSNLIYQEAGLQLPDCRDIPEADRQEIAKYHRQRWGGQAQEFLKGAKRYDQDGNHKLAMFLLHQSVESALSGVIRAAMGYRIAIHNLSRMLRLTLLFTEELLAVFELGTEEGKQSFALLQDAYSHARYRDGFEPSEKTVKTLMEKVESLMAKADDTYEQYSGSSKN